MAISFEKVATDAPTLVNMYKDAGVSLQKSGIRAKAKVVLCLDFSLSMNRLYQRGFVQKLAEKILALGLAFDDDGDIEVFFFGTDAWYAGSLSMNDFEGGIQRLIGRTGYGSTNYADAIKVITAHFQPGTGGFFRKAKATALDTPVFVVFITDGNPDSKSAAKAALIDASSKGFFWSFVGLGPDTDPPGAAKPKCFPFLKKLDELAGRALDNASFFAVEPEQIEDPAMSDEVLYDYLLKEFPDWLPQAQAAGYVKR